MRAALRKELEETGYIHAPLPIHEEEMRETRCLKKVPLESRLLTDMSSLDNWEIIIENEEEFGKYATMQLSPEVVREDSECRNSVKFTCVTRLPRWLHAFGRIMTVPKMMYHVDHENWEHINRISFWIYPDCPGFRSICMRMQFRNDGDHPVPDRYDREGHHNVNLVDRKWQYVSVEIPYIHRDDVIGLSFEYDMVGSEPGASDTVSWYITDVKLETLAEEDLDVYEGWMPGEHRIAFSGSGYQAGSVKTAIANEPGATSFKLVETATGRTVLEKPVSIVRGVNGEHQVLDFSEIQEPGEYLLVCGSVVTRSFPIGTDIWEDSIWKTINFLFLERCGYEVPGKHYSCHHDAYVTHEGKMIVANGGWHDAGDMTQTTTNTSECTYALFELLGHIRDNKLLYNRVLEEAKWGLDWVLRTRFGDGYRVASSSKSCWSDNIIGDADDIYREAAYETIENFMCAGAEALASIELKDSDPEESRRSLQCAKEDWGFGYAHMNEPDREKLDDGNRIYAPIVKYSAACWSAIDLYKAAKDEFYAEKAVEFAEKIMACQQTEVTDWDVPYVGFFYDDETKKLIAHCSHRSHDNEPVQALARLAELLPDHPNRARWMYAVNLYSDYAMHASQATAPFCVMPASIYHEDEAFHDSEYDMGMIARYLVDDERRDNYRKQVRNGVPLGKGYYLRREPVAFEHRGNHDVVLAGGKAVSQAAIMKNDYKLADLAQRQFEWIVGKNTFAESVMFGEGYDYCSEYAVLPGEMVGELGVGFTALDEHDSPFWPQVNSCVYKEVWIRSVMQYIWLSSDLHGAASVKGIAPKDSGKVRFANEYAEYCADVNKDTGWYETKLPAGRYTISCGDMVKHMDLLPAREYRLDAPFADIEVTSVLEAAASRGDESVRTGDEVEITVRLSGKSSAKVKILSVNLSGAGFDGEISGAEPYVLRGKIENPAMPYYAAVIPEGDLKQVVEVYGRPGEEK